MRGCGLVQTRQSEGGFHGFRYTCDDWQGDGRTRCVRVGTHPGAHSDKVPDQVVFLINDYMDPGDGGQVIDAQQMPIDGAEGETMEVIQE